MSGKYYDNNIEKVSEEDYLIGEGYSALGQSKSLNPLWVIVTILGSGVLILIAIFLWFFIRPQHMLDNKGMMALESRISHLEETLGGLEDLNKNIRKLESESNQFKLVVERFDRFENSMSVRMDKITRAIENLSKKTSITVPNIVKPEKPVMKRETTSGIKYHIVSHGETLYQISKRYGINVDDLRRINQLDRDTTIYPGQKLTVSRSVGD